LSVKTGLLSKMLLHYKTPKYQHAQIGEIIVVSSPIYNIHRLDSTHANGGHVAMIACVNRKIVLGPRFVIVQG